MSLEDSRPTRAGREVMCRLCRQELCGCLCLVCSSACLFICLSARLLSLLSLFVSSSACLLVCLSARLLVCSFACLLVYLSACMFVCLSVCLFVCSFARLLVCFSDCLLFCLYLVPLRLLVQLPARPPPIDCQPSAIQCNRPHIPTAVGVSKHSHSKSWINIQTFPQQ